MQWTRIAALFCAWSIASCAGEGAAGERPSSRDEPTERRDAASPRRVLDAGARTEGELVRSEQSPEKSGALDLERSRDAGGFDAGLAQGRRVGGFGPLPPPNPGLADHGFGNQHGDSAASDTSPLAGPGAREVSIRHFDLLAACPSVLLSRDHRVLALCTQIANQAPILLLLDPERGTVLAQREIAKGSLFGGVYSYIDREDRVVVVDGSSKLLRIGMAEDARGRPELRVEQSTALGPHLLEACGDSSCGGVVGLTPDYEARVWFATGGGVVGFVSADGQSIEALALGAGERVANSIASAPEGVAVVTDRALYLLRVDASGRPTIVLRAEYERGPARKPGQLSHGSGSTPTFFGPSRGSEYLALVDNASPRSHLLVYRAGGEPSLLCRVELPEPAGRGSEDSPIGSGRSVFVTGTYGYTYPALPENTPPSQPDAAPLAGGIARIDVAADERSCSLSWSRATRLSALPKLSLADGLLYTFTRETSSLDGSAGALDRYSFAVLDAADGRTLREQTATTNGLHDTMHIAGTIAPHGVLYQGTMSGIFRIAPR